MKIISITADQAEMVIGIDPKNECVYSRKALELMKEALDKGDKDKLEFAIRIGIESMIIPQPLKVY